MCGLVVWGVCACGSKHLCLDMVMDVSVLPPQEAAGRGCM